MKKIQLKKEKKVHTLLEGLVRPSELLILSHVHVSMKLRGDAEAVTLGTVLGGLLLGCKGGMGVLLLRGVREGYGLK